MFVGVGIDGIVRGWCPPICFPDDGIAFLLESPLSSLALVIFSTYLFPGFPSTFHLATVYLPTPLWYLSAPGIDMFYDGKISLSLSFLSLPSFSSLSSIFPNRPLSPPISLAPPSVSLNTSTHSSIYNCSSHERIGMPDYQELIICLLYIAVF